MVTRNKKLKEKPSRDMERNLRRTTLNRRIFMYLRKLRAVCFMEQQYRRPCCCLISYKKCRLMGREKMRDDVTRFYDERRTGIMRRSGGCREENRK